MVETLGADPVIDETKKENSAVAHICAKSVYMVTQITTAKISVFPFINYHRIGKDKTSLMSQCSQFVEWIL